MFQSAGARSASVARSSPEAATNARQPVASLRPASISNQAVLRLEEAQKRPPAHPLAALRRLGNRAAIQLLAARCCGADRSEQEAERTAGRVMRSPQDRAAAGRPPATPAGKPLPGIFEKPVRSGVLPLDFAPLHPKPATEAPLNAAGYGCDFEGEAPPVVHEVLASPGQSLDRVTRRFMEARFGHDFSRVHVHTDAKAAQSAAAVRADAYTVGSHIVFGRENYRPNTPGGSRLLAHELVHAIQQEDVTFPRATLRLSVPFGREEHAAERLAGVFPGRIAGIDRSTIMMVARQPERPEASRVTDVPTPILASPAAGVTEETEALQAPDIPERPTPTRRAEDVPEDFNAEAELPDYDTEPELVDYSGRVHEFISSLALFRARRMLKSELARRKEAAERQYMHESAERAEAAFKEHQVSEAPQWASSRGKRPARGRLAAELAVAKRRAQAEARKEIGTGTANIGVPGPTEMVHELRVTYEQDQIEDFQATLEAAANRYGRGWRSRLKNALRSKPKGRRRQSMSNEELRTWQAEQYSEKRTSIMCEILRIMHGWAVGRREEVLFRTTPRAGKALEGFQRPEAVPPELMAQIPEGLACTKEKIPGVAPIVVRFLRFLHENLKQDFCAGTYGGHGSWKDSGFGIDLSLRAPRDERGFYVPTAAVELLLNVDRAAHAVGVNWRALYNDFRVIDEVNRLTKYQHVTFQGSVTKKGGLNWHGPIVLHFHLDLVPVASWRPESQGPGPEEPT